MLNSERKNRQFIILFAQLYIEKWQFSKGLFLLERPLECLQQAREMFLQWRYLSRTGERS
jgi:hypothetical protein